MDEESHFGGGSRHPLYFSLVSFLVSLFFLVSSKRHSLKSKVTVWQFFGRVVRWEGREGGREGGEGKLGKDAALSSRLREGGEGDYSGKLPRAAVITSTEGGKEGRREGGREGMTRPEGRLAQLSSQATTHSIRRSERLRSRHRGR